MSNKFSSNSKKSFNILSNPKPKKQVISFRELGGLGRLANQMFQYASTRGIAANRNFDCAFPLPNDDIILYKCFKNTLKYSKELPEYDRVYPRGFHFDEMLFNECAGDRDILHYFQTEKYFKHIEDEIREDFKFDDFIFNSCNTYIKQLFPNTEIISLHIRRTDYVKDETMYALPLEYYENALKMMPDNLPIIIFSDDSEWCKNQELFSNNKFKIITTNNFFADLCMMTLCNYHIIANSSFSWWGAWLAKSKKVIAPKRWFRYEKNTWSTEDVCCSGWIEI